MDLAGAGPDDYQRLAEVLEGEFGRIDVLVHNAASFHALRPMLQQQPGEWLEIIQTSLTAPYMLTAVLAPLMSADATIVFIGDEHCLDKPGGWGAYGVAQAGRRQMARVLEAERARSGARVVEVDPGPFYSRLRVAAWPSDSPEHLPSPASAADRVVAAVREGDHS
jgi:NAD(P)-dependent dehydrogenase (short-subunit alcohol dehydrogenase family)